MSERQQSDHGAARLLLAVTGQQRFEGALIGSVRGPIGALIEEIRFADDSPLEGESTANSSLKMPNSC